MDDKTVCTEKPDRLVGVSRNFMGLQSVMKKNNLFFF
jgi:hypothetical protein